MNNKPIKDNRFTEILFTREQIEKRICELAQWVNEEYKDSKDLIFIGLLKGSIPFLSQLAKDVKVDHIWDFMTLSSYDGNIHSTGQVKIVMDLKQDIYNKDILIVEDIIDSGITLNKVLELLKTKKPRNIKILTLLDKPSKRIVDLNADKVGFIVPDKFLAGYGLDVKEKLRNLDFIGVFNIDYFDKI